VHTNPPPEQCTAHAFKVRIRAWDGSGVKRITVFLDGKRIKVSTHKKFSVLIRAGKLHAGRHTIKIVARDDLGNKNTKKRHFRRCHPAVSPPFTG
jgi:hypothetical protein